MYDHEGRQHMDDPDRTGFRRSQWAIAALFCSLGFQYATWASRIPALKARLHLNPAQVGLLLMVCGIGAAASFPLVSWLMRRLGSRRLALLSALCLAALLLALAAVPDYPLALAVLCGDGVAVGCLNVAMNAQGAALERRYGRTTMARLHAVFSAGSLAAALLASALNALTGSVPAHFAVAAALLVLLVGAASRGLLGEDGPAAAGADPAAPEGAAGADGTPGQGEAGTPAGRRRWALPARAVLWMGVAMVFGTVTEGAMNDWSALYLRDVAHAAAALAPMGIAVVSVMMVLARLFADRWRSRWGDRRIVLLGSAAAAAGLALALLSGGLVPALLGFACVGLGVAAVTPCVYVAAAAQGSDALSVVAATGTTGLLAGPPVIGFIADQAGLVWAMGAVAAAAALVSLCSTRIRWAAPPRPAAEAAPAPQPVASA